MAMASSVKRVASMRCRVPADQAAGVAGAVRGQVGDGGDLDAGRGGHLRQEHGAEFSRADQADAHRAAFGDALLQEAVQVHLLDSFARVTGAA